MTGCYYRSADTDGEYATFDPTDFTRSNWTPDLQHGSPPLALLTRAAERLVIGSQLRIGRLSLDILGAIPVQRVGVRAWVERPGRRICLLAAEMRACDTDRVVARLSGWALATTDTRDVATDRHQPLAEGPVQRLPVWFERASGYFDSVHWRYQRESPEGAAVSWLSPLVHLVDTDETTPLQRLAMVVDSANGVGATLDMDQFTFMNTDTVVHLHRLPTGTDFGLRARGSIGPDGIGVTTAEVFDRTGFIGTSAQTLLVQRR
ncbi:MAG TPA: thioesterase family protein [Mycobacterium sp.]|nr:thioesterase family protein [Mycobacterium sp.]